MRRLITRSLAFYHGKVSLASRLSTRSITPQISAIVDIKDIPVLRSACPQMLPTACLLPSAISDVFVQSLDSGKLTLADRYGLLIAVLASNLEEEEQRSLDRILYSVRRGRVAIADELSAIQ